MAFKGLTNFEINNALKPICNSFNGVFSSDTIPSNIVNGSIICNLSRADQFGTHFVTVIIKPTHILYIDTFGIPCHIAGIRNFMTSFNRPIYYNATQIQALSSAYCGYFAMLFCLQNDYEHISSLAFSTNLRDNDHICIQYLNQYLHAINK